MWVRTLLLSAFVAITAPLAATGARAQVIQPNTVMPAQDRGESRQQLRSLREILDGLRSRYGGEYVSHRLEPGERPIYVIRWRMPDGVTTRDFRVDAVSGQVR